MEHPIDVDILQLDESVRKFYKTGDDDLPKHVARFDKMKKTLDIPGLSRSTRLTLEQEIMALQSLIEELQSKAILCFYERDTAPILAEYRAILAKPIKMSFMGKSSHSDDQKHSLVNAFITVLKQYYGPFGLPFAAISIPVFDPKKKKCPSCDQPVLCDVIEGRTSICLHCGREEELFGTSSSYKDASRVNVSSKYTYERKIHFKDCMNQYQGKQNASIPDKCYEDIHAQLIFHCLLIGDIDTPKEVRYAKVTKSHIFHFLKETGWTKHYEDVNLIYHNVTGKRLDDISHLEAKLLDDFDVLSNAYDKKYKQSYKIERKSFINTQYVLFQLLRRHKHPCREEDFNMLKTLDRKCFLDDVCSQLFQELGWNFTPIF